MQWTVPYLANLGATEIFNKLFAARADLDLVPIQEMARTEHELENITTTRVLTAGNQRAPCTPHLADTSQIIATPMGTPTGTQTGTQTSIVKRSIHYYHKAYRVQSMPTRPITVCL